MTQPAPEVNKKIEVPTAQHWSLHKSEDWYECLFQMRPTEVLDGVHYFGIKDMAVSKIRDIMLHDGVLPGETVEAHTIWLRSKWSTHGSAIWVEKITVPDRDPSADDVMLLIRISVFKRQP